MRTSDHVFVLKSLIDKYFKQNKYIYACFIDLKKAFDTINRNALLHKLFQLNIKGCFFNVLESMYKQVFFSVILPDGLTEKFETNIGVKQGCILSPTLFSLYINDLVGHFNSDCTPLKLDDEFISCLLYADDIVLLSETSKGLQKSLDILHDYCVKWNLEVNINKTKVVIFNKSGRILKGFSFFYNHEPVCIVNEYKYLGIILKPSGTFSEAINQLSKKANKAIFCIRKTLYSNNSNVLLHTKLFETCVKPILLYCSEVWALPLLLKGNNKDIESRYDNFIPNKVLIKFSKYVLGVHKSASNMAVLGDIGLFPLSLNALKATVEFWFHLLKTKDNLLAKAYKDNLLIKDSWCNKLKTFLKEIGFGHIWENQGTFSKHRTLKALLYKLQDRYCKYWQKTLFNDDRVVGGNKLRTYRTFKKDFKREQFLFADVDKHALSDFIRIRVSNCNLNIERGRYLNLPVEQRTCHLCHNGVEDEFHFLMLCDKLNSKREELFRNITDIVPDFINLSKEDQFIFLLTSHDLDICKCVILGISTMYQVNQNLKLSL